MRSVVLTLVLALSTAAAALQPPPGEIELRGGFIPGGIVIGRVEPGTWVRFEGEAVQVGSDGRFVLAIPRDAAGRVVRLDFRGPEGDHANLYTVSEREFQVTRIEGVPDRTLAPSAQDLERIRAEQVQIDRARSRRDDRSDFAQPFIWPATGRISGEYGTARRYNDEDRLRIHWGVDVAMPVGTPVVAPSDGVITLAHPDLFYSGGTILMDHGHGMISSFLHLSALHVEQGQVVRRGELIGEIGATGRVTGPHLDWRIRLRGTWVDPATLVPPMEEVLQAEAAAARTDGG